MTESKTPKPNALVSPLSVNTASSSPLIPASTFHFTSISLDQQFFTDLQNINKFNSEQLSSLLYICLNTIREPNSEIDTELIKFSHTYKINMNIIKVIFKNFQFFLFESLKHNISDTHLKADLIQIGVDADKSQFISEQWKENYISLSSSMIGQTLVVNNLIDMQWKFGVTTGSDEANNMSNCFLQVQIVLLNSQNQKETVLMELSLSQFYQFLQEMTKALQSLKD